MCVELSSNGEREKNIAIIIKSVRQILGKPVDVFVPAVSQKVRGESQTMVYMDGYVFIRHQPEIQYMKLQDTTYFKTVLCRTVLVDGQRRHQYSLLDDETLEPMRDGVQSMKAGMDEYKAGQRVKVSKGTWKNLLGTVSEVYDGENVQISIKLKSKHTLMDFPVSYLSKVGK